MKRYGIWYYYTNFQDFPEELENFDYGFGDSIFKKCEHLKIYTMERNNPVYKDFSHYWIVIEQVIGKVKTFAACRDQIRTQPKSDQTKMRQVHNMCWIIRSVFVNESYQVTTAQ